MALQQRHVQKINNALKQYCKYDFRVVIRKKKDDKQLVELLRNDESISTVELEIYDDEIYMHSDTKEGYRYKKYNTFLRSVVILLSYYMNFSRIGSNASNWVSYYILYEDFDFHVDPRQQKFFPDFDSFSDQHPKLNKHESKQALKQLFQKKNPIPPFSLSLKNIDIQKYKDKCFDILKKLDC